MRKTLDSKTSFYPLYLKVTHIYAPYLRLKFAFAAQLSMIDDNDRWVQQLTNLEFKTVPYIKNPYKM